MDRAQRLVAIGAGTGVTLMVGALVGLSKVTPRLAFDADAGERLAFAVKWIALAAAPLFIILMAIGNARFKSEAIDPTAHKEDRSMIIDGRVAENTLQQFTLFSAAILAVAATSHGSQLSIVPSATIVFLIARAAFWIGYRIDPLYRAAGFASTAYLNVILFGIAIWRAWI
jgi:uncharacterized MAPEG superfamily protein